MSTALDATTVRAEARPKKAFYKNLWMQVLIAVGLAIVLGYVRPNTAAAMRPLGAFIRQGASFIALVGTLMVVPSIPVAGIALILGIDRFMSMFRAAVNVVGSVVATL